MAKVCRNTMDGKKRQASVLGSTLTSLTFLESDSTTSIDEESESDVESDTNEEDITSEAEHKLGEDIDCDENVVKHNDRLLDEKKQESRTEKESCVKPKLKPKVRMKTLTIDGQLVYFCVLCDKIFTRKKDKINHELAHSSNETLLSCPECGKEYVHGASLASHMRTHDGEQLHFCDLCPKMFAQNHQLKAHILSHSQPTEFPCKICNMECDTASDLNNHHRNKVKEEMSALWCDVCKIFCCRTHSADKDFSKIHAFQCSACNELFYTLKKLKLHSKKYAHKSINQHRKSLQSFDFDEKENNLKRELQMTKTSHVKIKGQLENDDDERPKSKKCRTSYLPEDLSESDNEVKPKFEFGLECSKKSCKRKPYCKKCNKSFKDSFDLVSHKLSAHCKSPGPLVCPVCRQEFSSNTDLEQHISKHKEDRDSFLHECNLCYKTFPSKLQLSQHVKLHSPHESDNFDGCSAAGTERETDLQNSVCAEVFECHICTKSFPFRYKLQNHLRLHTNIRSFQCYICQRNFVTKHYLQRHLQVHVKDGALVKTEPDSPPCGIHPTRHIRQKELGKKTGAPHGERDKAQIEEDIVTVKRERGCEVTNVGDGDRLHLVEFVGFDAGNNVSSLSEDSVCSFITRESERSDGCRFSSGSSHSFKISMARERRKLRKKKHLLKSPLRNCFNNMKGKHAKKLTLAAKSDVLVDNSKEEEGVQVKNLVVEINGVRSETDQETVIFVELTLAKPVAPRIVPPLCLKEMDKENKLPGFCNDNNNLNASEDTNGDQVDPWQFGKVPSSVLTSNSNLITLDLEVHDFASEKLFTSFDTDDITSDQLLRQEGAQLLGADSSNQYYVNEKFEQLYKKDELCSSKFTERMDNCISFSKSASLEDKNPFRFDVPLISVKEETTETSSVQPLHSLHLMTAKLNNDIEDADAKFLNSGINMTTASSVVRRNEASVDCGIKGAMMSDTRSSKKTCRDIAAAWKSSKNLNVSKKTSDLMKSNSVNKSRHLCPKPNLNYQRAESGIKIEINSQTSSTIHRDHDAFDGSFTPRIKQESSTSILPLPTVSSDIISSLDLLSRPLLDHSSSQSCNLKLKNESSHIVHDNKDTRVSSHSPFCSGSNLKAKDVKDNSSSTQPLSASRQHTFNSSIISATTNSASFTNTLGRSFHTTGGDTATHIQPIPGPQVGNNGFLIDTDNPALRNMNLMDMVSSIQTPAPACSSLTDPGPSFHTAHLSSTSQNSSMLEIKNFGGQQMPDSMAGTSNMMCPMQGNVVTPRVGYPSQVDIFGGGNNRTLGNPVNLFKDIGLNNNALPLPPLNILNEGINVNQFNGGASLCHSNIYRTQPHADWPPLSPFNRVDPQESNGMTNVFPQFHMPGNAGLINRSSYNTTMESLRLGNSTMYQGQAELISPNPGHFGLGPLPLGMANSIPIVPKLRNPGEILMGHMMNPEPLQPSLPLAYSQPMMPILPAGLAPGPSAILPNAGFLQAPPSKMNAGIFYLPF